MKKIKKIGGLVAVFLLTVYNICFADVLMPGDTTHPSPFRDATKEQYTIMFKDILIGILVLVIVTCAAIIIRRIIKKKKEKENDNK